MLFTHTCLLRGLLPLEISNRQSWQRWGFTCPGCSPLEQSIYHRLCLLPQQPSYRRRAETSSQKQHLLARPSNVWDNKRDKALGNTPTSLYSGKRGDAEGACGALGQGPLAPLVAPRHAKRNQPRKGNKPNSKPRTPLSTRTARRRGKGGLHSLKAHKARSHTANCTAQPRAGPRGSDHRQQTRELASELSQERQSIRSPH